MNFFNKKTVLFIISDLFCLQNENSQKLANPFNLLVTEEKLCLPLFIFSLSLQQVDPISKFRSPIPRFFPDICTYYVCTRDLTTEIQR